MEYLSLEDTKLLEVVLMLEGLGWKEIIKCVDRCKAYADNCGGKQSGILYTVTWPCVLVARCCSKHLQPFLDAGWREL